MREIFSSTLVALAKQDPKVLLLTGDHGYALFDAFRKECPSQYVNAGIAEQNMVGMAAGLARVGFKPIVYGLSAFIPVRVVEQIKLDIAHDDLPVTLVGDGAGFVYSSLGTSHQSTEDIACTRAIPQLEIYSPADSFELAWSMQTAYKRGKSCYLRMGKADRGEVHTQPVSCEMGALLKLSAPSNSRVALIATGSMVITALALAQSGALGLCSVYSAPSIKPLNITEVLEVCRSHRAIVVLEEHSTYGGLGSLISEISAEHHPTRVLRIGVEDRFSHACGSYNYLLEEHGLSRPQIEEKVRAWL